jgi:hypothetical protein
MGKLGIRTISFHEYVYLPCSESPKHHPHNFRDTMRWYYSENPTPREGVGWRYIHQIHEPGAHDSPRELRRERTVAVPGILRRYLFLDPLQAQTVYEGSEAPPVPLLPSCLDLQYDDGHREHFNPSIPRDPL